MEERQGEYAIYQKDPKRRNATVTFNRPEKLNAIRTSDYKEVRAMVQDAIWDEDIKSIVFKGTGRCFGSGHDVSDLGPHHGWGEEDRRPSQRRRLFVDKHIIWGHDGLMQTIYRCDKPTIAQVHGYCYGLHFQLALACDLVVCAEDARFTHPGFRYIGPLGEIALAINTIGVKKTKEIMLTGLALDAQEAKEAGLANKVVPMDRLDAEVERLVSILSQQPLDALTMGKANLELAMDIMGVGAGYTAGVATHVWQTNIRYEPDEFNLFQEKSRAGASDAIRKRDRRYPTDANLQS